MSEDAAPPPPAAGLEPEERRALAADLEWYAAHPELIARRLCRLERSWDRDRTARAELSLLALAGTLCSLRRRRLGRLLSLAATAMRLQQLATGSSPAAAIARRLGVRSRTALWLERYGLRALRGERDALLGGRYAGERERLPLVLGAMGLS